MTSLYDQLGGNQILDMAIKRFYERVLEDPLLRLHFEDVNMTKKIDSFRSYIVFLLGGAEKYTGKSIYTSHRGREISDFGFDLFVGLFVETLREMNLSEDIVVEINKRLAALKNQVVDSFVWPGKHYYAKD